MAKTIVLAKHGYEQHTNGTGGCHTRWAHDGYCSGVTTARWLNSLGDDDEPFSRIATNGEVRQNWLQHNDHIVAADPFLASLSARASEAHRESMRLMRQLRAYKAASNDARR
jgi:hypothetical protein